MLSSAFPQSSHRLLLSELSILQDPAPGDENAVWLHQGCQLHLDSLWCSPDDHLVVPQVLLPHLAGVTHLVARTGKRGVIAAVQDWFAPNSSVRAQQYCSTCPICLVHNIRRRVKTKVAAHPKPCVSFVNLQMDFIQMHKCCNYKYISVIVNIFSGWVEACPCRNADATTLTKKVLRECLTLEYPVVVV